ncbi:MAG TPA: cytochrome ubiquinol oxidase subunit I, partial [Negativicutes bacterium]
LVAVMETLYVRTGNEMYKKMAQFWGKLFLINFSMGVATGIVQEFHFGMNWSEYSRFMGDIFGAPLALEALSAFFLESVFIGLWIFGWDRLSKRLHLACIWLVAFASNLSAFWILTANSFMQSPVGYVLQNGRAEMVDFGALITNRYLATQFPHAVMSGLVTAGVFIMAISAYQLLRKNNVDVFRKSYKIGMICTLLAVLGVMGSGHLQMQYLAKAQPMKLAAAEALWDSANPAPFALVAVPDEVKQNNTFELKIPGMLTLLTHDSFNGEIKGIKELQAAYSVKYGPGDYIPPVTPVFWSFRIMVIAGGWMLLLTIASGWLWFKGKLESYPAILKALLWSLPVPYIANSAGWFVTEAGRQPWIVFGLQKVAQANSPNVTAGMIWTSMLGFTLVYSLLAVAAIYLMRKTIAQSIEQQAPTKVITDAKGATLWN